MNAKDEINKAIGVLEARMEYVLQHEPGADLSEEWDLLSKAISSLEKWRDSSSTRNLPEIPRQMIWFKQMARICCKENGYTVIDPTIT